MFIRVGIDNVCKCSSIWSRSRHLVCVCIHVCIWWGRVWHRQGKGQEEERQLACLGCHALYLLPTSCCLSCGHVFWCPAPHLLQSCHLKTVICKLACAQCCAKSQSRCQPLASSPLLNRGWHRNLHTASHPPALSVLQPSQRRRQNNALKKLLLVLRRKWAERKRCTVWAKRSMSNDSEISYSF